MVSLIPSSGSGSSCEATSNGWCHGMSLCAPKKQNVELPKMFQMQKLQLSQGHSNMQNNNGIWGTKKSWE
jgi:hypothetical protein